MATKLTKVQKMKKDLDNFFKENDKKIEKLLVKEWLDRDWENYV